MSEVVSRTIMPAWIRRSSSTSAGERDAICSGPNRATTCSAMWSTRAPFSVMMRRSSTLLPAGIDVLLVSMNLPMTSIASSMRSAVFD